MADIQKVVDAIVSGISNDKFGLKPYQPGYNFPQDLGLGGVSTEYVATERDPEGRVMNFPTIWYDQQGMANLLPQDQAYDQALAYERGTAQRFPRFDSVGNAETFAKNRSAMGGAENAPLASLFGLRNY